MQSKFNAYKLYFKACKFYSVLANIIPASNSIILLLASFTMPNVFKIWRLQALF